MFCRNYDGLPGNLRDDALDEIQLILFLDITHDIGMHLQFGLKKPECDLLCIEHE
jgi:hypothetical protein